MIGELAQVARFIARHPLTRRRRAEAFLRFAGFQLQARLKAEVIVPWIEGAQLAVRRGMTGATGNVYAGLHDYAEMAFLLHFLRPGDLFYDVGANVGCYTVLASGVCGASSLAFEPDSEAAAALRRNVEINEVTDLVSLREAVVGAADGVVGFTTGLGVCNHVAADGQEGLRQVPMTTLDTVSTDSRPALLKIDVEGFNSQVVAGGRSTLASEALKAIIIEWPSAVVDLLLASGFARVHYDPVEHRFDDGPARDDEPNALFIRDLKFVEDRVAGGRRFRVCGLDL